MSPDTSAFFDYAVSTPGTGGLAFLEERSPEDWALVLQHTEARRFAPGDIVIRAGDEDRSLYLVLAGVLTVQVPGAGNVGVREVEAPSIVGEVAFFDGGMRSTTLVAVTAGEVRRLTPDGFETLCGRHPELGRAMLMDLGRMVARRLRTATTLLGEHVG